MTHEISVNQIRKSLEVGGLGVLRSNDTRPQIPCLDCACAPFCQFLVQPECSLSI